ncbi:hypothetical protein COX11_02240 [Candidatus Berkelbacteria bacterium CG23_combo_of_CG06-09_8_20_14_all_41_73]|uniref:HTH HARE-type domain-containing protein n=2 Tax=Candidatus Berkelbacteria TaxID=1618330 RepID=A0A2H0AZK7_9BACT|nr:MAG: hypothetical protein COX11_02240 [Candidatus Berkelbacteria bacterium CG23_combo_of_CG06-09_8_20_14_all_41_73]PIR27300.1 MAG: hypothetical protein COV40_01645 [Candidatus Berkelbacteria bacterium CG11_big_fil_rev_8_21_14_0_20_42_15]
MGALKVKSHRRQSLALAVSELILILNDKEKRVISGRFGLTGRRETLSAIGRELHLSRERVRQIEKNSLRKLAAEFSKNYRDEIGEIVQIFEKVGGVITDEEIPAELTALAHNHKFAKNYLRLVFSIMDKIERVDESADLKDGWRLKNIPRDRIFLVCNKMIQYFTREKLPQATTDLIEEIPGLDKYDPTFLEACISLSARITMAKNGMIGLKTWPTINPRNIRDKIYYVLKTADASLHFTEITANIAALKFDNKHVVRATVHNELIADKRFVLIGRGIYALREWGYSDGTVYDVIKNILSAAKGPMSVPEIIELVSKSRKVKKNTIIINLQTKKEFKRVEGGFVYKKL